MLGDVTAAPAAQPRAGAKRRASGGCAGGEAGGAALGEGAGVIPRALALLFRKAAEAKAGGWSFEFEASLVEVYNEELRDLLPAGGAKEALPKLELRHERSGEVSVPNLTVHAVASEADAQGLLARAAGARATAKTGCNEHSSRSHSVFILRVAGEHADGGAVRGCLTLVDLAGSERVKVCGAPLDPRVGHAQPCAHMHAHAARARAHTRLLPGLSPTP
jgi:kinesin family protein C1